ncbi:MAG: two-component system, OmpR family, sensor kinase [Actinomycetota bacterium]|nr:two-component system, OmpR family, sensor kinase [Actinomycetota bacterium]
MSERAGQVLRRLRRLPAGTPLRVRLVVALLALVAIALVATGVTATTQLKGYLVSQVDQELEAPFRPGGGRGDGPGAGDDSPFQRSRAEWYRLYDSNGSVLDTAGDSGVSPPKLSWAQTKAAAGDAPFTVPSAGRGDTWRVSVRSGTLSDTGQPVVVVRAISLHEVDDTVHRLVVIQTFVGLVVLVLLGGAGYVVVRRSLRPLVEVENTAAAIAGGDLTQRVPESDPRTEVGGLSRALNGMLAQIESAFRAREASEVAARASEDRMRRFVADASHELRTPLTSIRGFAELYRQGAASRPEDVARVMRRVEDSAAQMGVLVDDLLLLARLDQQRPLERTPVDLVVLAADAVHDAQAVAPDRRITLDVAPGPAPVVQGDEVRLRQVLSNLVSNALHHTPAGTPVDVTVAVAPGAEEVRLAVRDRGPGLAAEDAARIFERFYRADASRTRSAGGTGLGLSIVAALVAAHGGQAGVDTAPGQGATFWVRLPLDTRLSHPADAAAADETGEGTAEVPTDAPAAHQSVTGS